MYYVLHYLEKKLSRDIHELENITDLKQGIFLWMHYSKNEAINYFYNLINVEICEGVTICVVPSSDSEKTESGIGMLGERLAENNRKNKVYFLRRIHTIDKLAYNGRRDKEIHMETISTLKEMDITGEIILLMDDVTTTGNSLYACKDILLQNGAKTVNMFALGKAI